MVTRNSKDVENLPSHKKNNFEQSLKVVVNRHFSKPKFNIENVTYPMFIKLIVRPDVLKETGGLWVMPNYINSLVLEFNNCLDSEKKKILYEKYLSAHILFIQYSLAEYGGGLGLFGAFTILKGDIKKILKKNNHNYPPFVKLEKIQNKIHAIDFLRLEKYEIFKTYPPFIEMNQYIHETKSTLSKYVVNDAADDTPRFKFRLGQRFHFLELLGITNSLEFKQMAKRGDQIKLIAIILNCTDDTVKKIFNNTFDYVADPQQKDEVSQFLERIRKKGVRK